MARKGYILLWLCALTSFIVKAQNTADSTPWVSVSGDTLLHVSLPLPAVTITANAEDSTYLRIDAQGLVHPDVTEGSPSLPVATTLLFLPSGSRLTVEKAEATEVQEIPLPNRMPLTPAIRPWAKGAPRPSYWTDPKVYEANLWHRGGEPVQVENLGMMGDRQLFRLTVRPVAYNPVLGLLRLHALRAEVHIVKSALSAPSPSTQPQRLLVVSRPQFAEGLQPFIRWKRQEGYDVQEVYSPTHLRDSVKALIEPYFHSASVTNPMPRYLLIVGDAAQIQSFIGSTSLDGEGHITDLPYGEYTGDHLPEAMVGRWPVNDTSQLNIVVRKTLAYEQLRGIDTAHLRRVLLVAGEEDASVAPITTNGQVNYVSGQLVQQHPDVDTLCYRNPASGSQLASITDAIGQGMTLLNYTAHCTVGGWSSPSLSASRVEAAGTPQPAVYINNCCKSNDFGGTCFGEQLLRLPQGGAVGVVGATNSTLWAEDFYWAVGPRSVLSLHPLYDSLYPGAFDALTGRNGTATTLGETMLAGNLAVSAFGSPSASFYWEIYTLLGDPTLQPWIGIPQQVSLSILSPAANGDAVLHVATTPRTRVSAVQGDTLIGTAVSDASGHATLLLNHSLDTLPLLLTASGTGIWPRTDTLNVLRDVDYGIAIRQASTDSTGVRFIIENIGHQPVTRLAVGVWQTPADSASGAWLTADSLIIDSLPAGAQTQVTLPVLVSSVANNALWQAHIGPIGDSTHSLLWVQPLPAVPLTLSPTLTERDGAPARFLLPSHTYSLTLSGQGVCHSLEVILEAYPLGQTLADTTVSSLPLTLPFSTPDSLCALHLLAVAQVGHDTITRDYWIEAGSRMESFESAFLSHPWYGNGMVHWIIDSSQSRSGSFSARSGPIGNSQLSDLCIEVETLQRDSVSFYVRCSTEERYDKFTFLIDGNRLQPEAWGSSDWQRRKFTLDAGRHTLCWRYSKDAAGSDGEDCVWIDDVRLPLSLWDSAYAWPCGHPSQGIPTLDLPTPAVRLFPNPATGQTSIHSDEEAEITISDALGRPVTSFILHADETRQINCSSMPSGIYLVQSASQGRTGCTKLIINQ